METTPLAQVRSRTPPPDAVAIRRLPVPDLAPPYDDEPSRPDEDHEGNAVWPVAAAADPPPGPAGAEPADRRGRADRRDPPDPAAAWPGHFAQVLAETLAGSRPVRQLAPWTSEQARQRIRQLGPMLACQQRPKVRRVLASAPAPGVLELTAVVGFGPRVRALALRLERRPAGAAQTGAGSWCCTTVESA
jgi:Family of unknown function (DUF6459)